MDNRQNLQHWLAISLMSASIGVGLSAPFFLVPCTLFASGIGVWLLRGNPGLPRKSELIARSHREKWRQGLEVEFSEKSGELIATVQSREVAIQNQAVKLQSRQDELVDWEKQLVAAEGRLTNALRQQEQYYLELIDRIEENMRSELQLRENAIASLQQRFMKLANRPDPKQGFAAWVAHLLLEALQSQDIFCRMHSYRRIPGSRTVSIWIEIDSTTNTRKLESLAKEVGSHVNLGEPLINWDADECLYEFCFDPQILEEEIPEFDDEIRSLKLDEPTSDWLAAFISKSERLSGFISGDSGAGKSTLVNNYVCLIKRILEAGGESADVVIIDAKDPDTPWKIDGKMVIPQYGGVNDPDDEDGEENWIDNDVLTGIKEMKRDVYSRLRAKRTARDKGEAEPKFPKRIYVIDEAEEIYSIHGKEASKPILSAARLGRSSGLAVVVIGQNANPSAYGFQIPNLNNFAKFYLRENARRGIADCCATASQKRPLLEQVAIRERISKGLEPKDPRRFWGFVKISGEPGFVGQMPAPDTYYYPVEETPEIEIQQDYPDIPIPGKPTIYQLVEDAKKTDKINDLKAKGETRLTKIIEEVWGCASGSRQYRKAREEYKRLMGE